MAREGHIQSEMAREIGRKIIREEEGNTEG